MKFRVIVQPPARIDIESAYIYNRDASSEASANRWLDGLEAAIAKLETFPRRCGPARESAEFEEEIRQLLYGKRRGTYRVLFVVRGDEVRILHVRHSARSALPP